MSISKEAELKTELAKYEQALAMYKHADNMIFSLLTIVISAAGAILGAGIVKEVVESKIPFELYLIFSTFVTVIVCLSIYYLIKHFIRLWRIRTVSIKTALGTKLGSDNKLLKELKKIENKAPITFFVKNVEKIDKIKVGITLLTIGVILLLILILCYLYY